MVAALVLALLGCGTLAPKADAQSLSIEPGQSWSAVLDDAEPGSKVVVKAGVHPFQKIEDFDGRGIVLVGQSRTETVVRGLYLKNVTNLSVRSLTSSPVGSARQAAFQISFATRAITLDDVTAIPRTTASSPGFDVSRGGAASPSDILISDVYYDGSQVSGPEGRGLRVWGGNVAPEQWPTRVTLLRAKLVGSSADLVQVAGGRDVTIADSSLMRPQTGEDDHIDAVQSYASLGLTVRGNRISGPGPYVGPDHAIILGHAKPAQTHLRVRGSTVTDNEVDGWRGQGVLLGGAEDTTLLRNTVSGLNPQASGLVIASNGDARFVNTGYMAQNSFGKVTVYGGNEMTSG